MTCFHNCSSVETAVDEMQSVVDRKRSTRGDTDPVFHYILSWPEHECPRPEQIQDCISHTLNRLGLTGHQFMAAVHTDTDNLHVHVAVNRIHPETFRTRAVGMAIDRLHKACRELEIKHGFALTNGNFIVDENQQIVRRSAHERKQLSAWNCDAQENFRNYIRVKTLPFAGKFQTQGWRAFYLFMGSKGLTLDRMSNGEFAVRDIRNPERFVVPLSDFGHEWKMQSLVAVMGRMAGAFRKYPAAAGKSYGTDRYSSNPKQIMYPVRFTGCRRNTVWLIMRGSIFMMHLKNDMAWRSSYS